MSDTQKTSFGALAVVMLCFFTMGFVDLVGIASNYVQQDLGLTHAQANIMPSLVFFWFLIFSVPTGILMNKIGRKKTVLLSILITVLSLLLPLFGESYALMLCAFSLLGIGNALMQTSLNPLVSNIVSGNLASTLTFGQFVKAIASFLAPYIAMWGATAVLPSFGLGWRVLFPIYGIIGVIAIVALSFTTIHEEPVDKGSGFVQCFKLLGNPFILLCFLGIMCHVGIDVGTNTTAPKILMERLGMELAEAGFATSLYFIFRTIGCLSGSAILRLIPEKVFFAISVCMIIAAMILLGVGTSQWVLYTGIALVGFGNSNIFSICFAQALEHDPMHKNEISGLMIMGLFGGTIFPLCMGYMSDLMGSVGAVLVMAVGAIYLACFTLKLKKA
ncbi:MAG: MFS transporter [Paludibacteraceae bacterium]|nr:MFS transporter [Paludibacteraceae bacterium]